jgi:hypothetical protein
MVIALLTVIALLFWLRAALVLLAGGPTVPPVTEMMPPETGSTSASVTVNVLPAATMEGVAASDPSTMTGTCMQVWATREEWQLRGRRLR